MNVGEKVLALKSQVERAQRDAARQEATAEASERRLQEIDALLRGAGLDAAGDLEAQIGALGAEIQRELRDVEEELRTVAREAEQPRSEGAVPNRPA